MDENDKIVPAGVSGELCTRGKTRGCIKRTRDTKVISGAFQESCAQ